MYFNTLALQITYKCTAACKICAVSCTPLRDDKMEIKDAKSYIDQIKEFKQFRNLSITGGEPFIYFHDMCEILEYAKLKGLSTTIITNGYWGSDYEKTLLKLKRLKSLGLSKLSVSHDEFHQEYVPPSSIRNLLKAANSIDLPVFIGIVVTKSSKRLHHIAEDLKNCLLKTYVHELPYVPVNGNPNIPEEDNFYLDKQDMYCNETSIMLIGPDGKTYPCCGQGTGTPALYIGSAKEEPVSEIIKNYYGNMYCRMIYSKGFSWFLDIIQKEKLDIRVSSRHTHPCQLCNELFRDKKKLKLFEPFLDEEAEQIIKKYKTV